MKHSELSIPRSITKLFNSKRFQFKYLCKAPFTALSVGYNGMVSPCCYTQFPDEITGNEFINELSLEEIWSGKVFEKFRKLFLENKMPPSCFLCREKLMQKDFNTVKICEFDHLPMLHHYPSLIELNIDNSCNLECVMCNSMNSSRIAERYGIEKRVCDTSMIISRLNPFLPYVAEMIFSGGEPFLSEIYFGIWEELIKVNPECKITLNTNATIMNHRVKNIIGKGNFHFNISLDSIVKETYEKIRVHSKFETFTDNFDYLCEYSRRKNFPVSAPVCPLVQNYKEIPDLITFCNERNVYMVFLHVFGAHHVALNAAPAAMLEDALHLYENKTLKTETNVEKHNAMRFHSLLADVKNWIAVAKKQEAFIKELDLDTAVFQHKIEVWKNNLALCVDNDNESMFLFKKIEKIFDNLPGYFRSGFFADALRDYSPQTYIGLLRKLPAAEIAEYFRIIFRQKINQ